MDGPGPHPMVLEGEEEEKGPLQYKAEFVFLLMSLAIGSRGIIQYPQLAIQHGGGMILIKTTMRKTDI